MPDRPKPPGTALGSGGPSIHLTTLVKESLISSVAGGANREAAAARAGISRATFLYWLKRGRAGEDPVYVELYLAIKKAEAECLVRNSAIIQKAAQGGSVVEKKTITVVKPDGTSTTTTVEKVAQPQWQAAAWYLERKHPHEYGLNRSHVQMLEHKLAEALDRLAHLNQALPSAPALTPSPSHAPQFGGPVHGAPGGGVPGTDGPAVPEAPRPGPGHPGGGSTDPDW